jgi:glucan phosphorylase
MSEIYFLIYHVKPLGQLYNAENIGGAYVSCWIEGQSLKEAKSTALKQIKLAKWEVLEIDEARLVNEKYYRKRSTGLEFYEQALLDKWVLRFHTYPVK